MSVLSESAAEWVSVVEAAEFLGVTTRTIRNYVAQGTLTGYRAPTGRKIRLRVAEVRDLLRPIANGSAK
jgi:excisionase family DNA binding protein